MLGVKNPTHPIDLQIERENLIAAQLVSNNDVLIRATGDDYINVTRDEDSLPPLRMARQLPPLLTSPTPLINDQDDNSPPVRIVKKRLPPKSLPPITNFKLPPKTNSDDT